MQTAFKQVLDQVIRTKATERSVKLAKPCIIYTALLNGLCSLLWAAKCTCGSTPKRWDVRGNVECFGSNKPYLPAPVPRPRLHLLASESKKPRARHIPLGRWFALALKAEMLRLNRVYLKNRARKAPKIRSHDAFLVARNLPLCMGSGASGKVLSNVENRRR